MTTEKLCTIEGCDRTARAKGMCQSHYLRQRRGVPVAGPIHSYTSQKGLTCKEGACTRPTKARGYCQIHYTERRRQETKQIIRGVSALLATETFLPSQVIRCEQCGDYDEGCNRCKNIAYDHMGYDQGSYVEDPWGKWWLLCKDCVDSLQAIARAHINTDLISETLEMPS